MAASSSSGSPPSDMMYQYLTSDEPLSKRGKMEAAKSRQPRRSNKESGKPNPLISPTEKCKVCLEPAAKHMHYGAVTCFSCRAFFRRSIQNHSSESYKCRKEGHCDVSLKARKSCQRCRFERCIEIGMKSNWVLSEEERHHRFRKQRERMKQENGEDIRPSKDHRYLDEHEDERNGGELYNNHRHLQNEHSEDEDSHHEHHRDSSPSSSQGYGGIDSDTERSFHQYGHSMSPQYVTPPPMSPHNAIKSEPDYGEPSHVSYLPMDFLIKQSEPFLPFDMLTPHTIIFPVPQQPNEELMVSCEPCPSPAPPDVNCAPPMPEVEIKRAPSATPAPSSAPDFEPMSVDGDRMNDPQPNVINRERDDLKNVLPPHLVADVTADEISQIKAIARIHDINYKSINFGEELIKEMVMSSMCKVSLSPSATMTAYRLMIQRVTKVAQGFDPFINLQYKMQSTLLKHNADLIVSLRGAVFFEKRKGGLDQILISMGVDDLMAAKNMVMRAIQTTELNRIDYQTFNSLQRVENSQVEARYNALLQRVGTTVSFDADLVKILSYVLLFSVNFSDREPSIWRSVERVQEVMIGMMQRYIYAQYPRTIAVQLFSGLLHCVADLQELTWIKKQRQMATQAAHIAAEDTILLTDANKPKHFKN